MAEEKKVSPNNGNDGFVWSGNDFNPTPPSRPETPKPVNPEKPQEPNTPQKQTVK